MLLKIFKLKYSWFTMLSQFLLCSKGIQPYISTCYFSPSISGLSLSQVIGYSSLPDSRTSSLIHSNGIVCVCSSQTPRRPTPSPSPLTFLDLGRGHGDLEPTAPGAHVDLDCGGCQQYTVWYITLCLKNLNDDASTFSRCVSYCGLCFLVCFVWYSIATPGCFWFPWAWSVFSHPCSST